MALFLEYFDGSLNEEIQTVINRSVEIYSKLKKKKAKATGKRPTGLKLDWPVLFLSHI